MAKADANQVIKMVEGWYAKLPPLPRDWNEIIVKIIPWVALVIGLLGVWGFVNRLNTPFGLTVDSILAVVASVLMAASFMGIKAQKRSGWDLLFWSLVVTFISALWTFSPEIFIGALIGFYILFQIKPSYHQAR